MVERYRYLCSIVLGALLAGCSMPGGGASTPSTAAASGEAGSPAATYCVEKGGTVKTRYPTYNTNGDPTTWLRMGGERQFCEFTAQDSSHIAIAVDTLYSEQPTLAVLAYLEKPPLEGEGTPSANPSSLYCSQLGGTDLWGGAQGASGGGWTTDDASDPFQVISSCMFSDMSTIDSWGLTYHADGTIRGIDLTTVLRYNDQNPPRVFGSPTGSIPTRR